MACVKKGSFRWFYTGNQVGFYNHTGLMNFVAGGPPGSGISASTVASLYFPVPGNRRPQDDPTAKLDQNLLDVSYPFIELNWVCDIELVGKTFRVSNKNVYVEDEDSLPRFYEGRCKSPQLSITLGEWLNPQLQVGDVRLELNNRDGYFNDYLPQGSLYQQWTGSKITIKVGYGEKITNYFDLFIGFVAPKLGVTSTDETITLLCYDKFDEDDVSIPSLTFDTLTFPDIDDQYVGKIVPYLYGDWTTDVGDHGYIPGVIVNAKDTSTSLYEVKIADNELQTITEVWLHRGIRVESSTDGPIKLKNSALTLSPSEGKLFIPTGAVVLEEPFVLLTGKAGVGSSMGNTISDSASVDFLAKGVQVGDLIVNAVSPSQIGTVTSVSSSAVGFSGGFTIAVGSEYSISTVRYKFLKGDKISVKCSGKLVNNLFKHSLADFLPTATPVGLSMTNRGTYFFADNVTRIIYEADFNGVIKKQIPYANINAALGDLSGIDYQADDNLWVFDKTNSKMYRYAVTAGTTNFTLATTAVSGLATFLTNVGGFCADENDQIYLVNNATGIFYRINALNPGNPIVTHTWSRTAFDSLAIETLALGSDDSQGNLVVSDKSTRKIYRISRTTGAIIGSSFSLDLISTSITYPVGIFGFKDKTIFLLDRTTLALYNYNEYATSTTNAGFIARDLLQRYAGKTPDDFDVLWNNASRDDLSDFKCRIYLNEKTTLIKFLSKMLAQFNTSIYIYFGRYALFHMTFDNFKSNEPLIREGDIALNSFNPSKEYNQYFNIASCTYAENPFLNKSTNSDSYMSMSGLTAAGKEIAKKMDLSYVYQNSDVNKLLPLFVRLAAAEPEFITLDVGFRFLFVQLNSFFRINFNSNGARSSNSSTTSGRRFENVPCFVRQILCDLDKMSFKLKVWSLGTTSFGDYVAAGNPPGGQTDQIVLTNLGTPGIISPVGTITASAANSVNLAIVSGQNAQARSSTAGGLAWQAGMVVDLVDAATQAIVETKTILSVSTNTVTFTENLTVTPVNTVFNAAGFASSGHFLRYSTYPNIRFDEKKIYAFLSKPLSAYPTSSTTEKEEQKGGLHNLSDGRIPYLLHSKDFVIS